MSELDHLSYSSITAYLDCPENWRRKYIAKEPTKSSPALVFGSAFHGTLERLVTQPEGDVLSMWHEEWNKALDRQEIFWGIETPEEIFNDGVRMWSDAALLAEVKKIKPKQDEKGWMVERKVSLSVPGVPVPVIGFIDVILADGTPADFKTSSKSWSDDKAADSLQSLFYLAALNQAGMKINWKFQHIVFVKLKTPKVQMIEHAHTPGELFFLFELIKRVWDGISKDVYPLNPSTWKCSSRFCDYYADCRGKYA